MIEWTRQGEGHLTYIPRKPNPLGFKLKTMNDSETGILLHAKIVEGATVDRQKELVAELKPTTACTLRLTKFVWGSGMVVIADAWFASVRIVEELRDVGLYAIMSIENGSAGFPKAQLRS